MNEPRQDLLQWAVGVLAAGQQEAVPDGFQQAFRLAGLPVEGQTVLPPQRLEAILSQVILGASNPTPALFPFAELGKEPCYPSSQHLEEGNPQADPDSTPPDASREIPEDRQDPNRALLFLERYGTFRALSTACPHVSFYDGVKTAAAIQAALDHRDNANDATPFLLVAADFSGIQDFVYTISSKGALKTLRANSFLLEMLTEHLIYEVVCHGEHLTRACVVYSGGGGFALLLPNTAKNEKLVERLKARVNEWLLHEFAGTLYLAVAWQAGSEEAFGDAFSTRWSTLLDKVEADKRTKFAEHLNDKFFEPKLPEQDSNGKACQISHRDDIDPKRMVDRDSGEEWRDAWLDVDGKIPVFDIYHHLFHLGNKLTRFKAMYRLKGKPSSYGYLRFPPLDEGWTLKTALEDETAWAYYVAEEGVDAFKGDLQAVWAKNDWSGKADEVGEKPIFPLLVADHVRAVADLPVHAQQVEKEKWKLDHGDDMREPERKTAAFAGLAEAACGANLIAALRMDVDNLGLIFSEGLQGKTSLAAYATLSRQLSLFFTVYLNDLCRGNAPQRFDLLGKGYVTRGSKGREGRNVSVIYAGGDDLFIVGAWDETAELAYEIHQAFKCFVGDNDDVGLSAGLTLHKPTFPLYQMTRLSGEALAEAKQNIPTAPRIAYRRDSLALFYTRDARLKKKHIKDQLDKQRRDRVIALKDTQKTRLTLSIAWSEFEPYVREVLEWFDDKRVKPTREGAAPQRRISFKKGFPAGFNQKMLRLVTQWHEEGDIVLADLMWLLRLHPDKYDRQHRLLKMFQGEQVAYLHVPLTWIEYLKR